jgi:carbon storage regulator CsrA
MLVLSRRPGEKILFPAINSTVQVVAVKSGAVRLGIEAPAEVTVLREEIAGRAETRGRGASPPPGGAVEPTLCQLHRLLRNWLDVAGIGLALLRRQAEEGSPEATLGPFDREIEALRRQMQGMGRHPLPKSKVLVVQGDRGGRESLADSLRLAGLDVVTACDGGAALDHLGRQGLPDVLLLHMRLSPPCDGPTLVRTIRHDPANAGLKIFGVTVGGPGGFGPAGGSGGVDHWFNTPLNAEALLHDLNQELAGVV